jgi:hypothetical protein
VGKILFFKINTFLKCEDTRYEMHMRNIFCAAWLIPGCMHRAFEKNCCARTATIFHLKEIYIIQE